MNKLCTAFAASLVVLVGYNLFSFQSAMNEVEKTQELLKQSIERRSSYNVERDLELERLKYIEHAQEIECLARNMYFEARGEGQAGIDAVAFVTINRVRSQRYPNTVCEVVYQARLDRNGNPIRHKCQFSWYCDGRPDVVNENTFERLYRRAEFVYINYYLNDAMKDTTRGSTHYHARRVNPHWSRHRNYQQVAHIGEHVFYRPTY
jgi:spore germination cell wall hydrolase CwlJ-like protein